MNALTPGFISPLDGNFISLKRAALLIAREQPGIESDDIMELFKHAIFAGEFEREESRIHGIKPADDWSLPLLRIEAPRRMGLVPRLPLDAQPQEYIAVKAMTVAEILSERDALPGGADAWSDFAPFPRGAAVAEDMLHALAHIRYSAFPPRAHTILGDILLAKGKLRAWMILKGYELPSFLKNILSPAVIKPVAKPVETRTDSLATDAARGRPRKAGWRRIEELIREMYAADPASPRSVLAFDTHKTAATEFDEKELPSLETITRRMKTILGSER
jgi:hypothetical protein